MSYITNKSALAYEVVRITGTKRRVSVFAGMNGASPVLITRKLYQAGDGRLFVAYANGFCPVIAPDANDTVYRFGFGNFVRGAWHWVDGIGWEEGVTPEAEGEVATDAKTETAEAGDGGNDTGTEPVTDGTDDGAFNILDFFS